MEGSFLSYVQVWSLVYVFLVLSEGHFPWKGCDFDDFAYPCRFRCVTRGGEQRSTRVFSFATHGISSSVVPEPLGRSVASFVPF